MAPVIATLEEMLIGRTARPPAESLAGWEPERQGTGWLSCPRCASTVGAFEADLDGCARCREKKLRWDRAIRLGRYEGALREQVLMLKYSRWRPAGVHLGRLLGEALRVRMRAEGLEPSGAVLIPAPMSWRRRTSRGLDHAGLLADAAARAMDCRVVRALHRKHGPAQASVTASRRPKNVSKTMRCRRSASLAADAVVVLVDDIRTTGATLTEAWRALEADGLVGKAAKGPEASVGRRWVATLAVVDGDSGGGIKG